MDKNFNGDVLTSYLNGMLDLPDEAEQEVAKETYNAKNEFYDSIGIGIPKHKKSVAAYGFKPMENTWKEQNVKADNVQKEKERVAFINDGARVFASGKYQTIPTTLQEAVVAGYASPTDKYDGNTQEKVMDYLLTRKRKAVGNYINGSSSSLDAALLDLAKEWASMPSPKRRVVKGKVYNVGDSYYGGANKSGTSLKDVRAILKQARATNNDTGIRDLIGKHESNNNYNAYNSGTVDNKIVGATTPYDFSNMSIEEILGKS